MNLNIFKSIQDNFQKKYNDLLNYIDTLKLENVEKDTLLTKINNMLNMKV